VRGRPARHALSAARFAARCCGPLAQPSLCALAASRRIRSDGRAQTSLGQNDPRRSDGNPSLLLCLDLPTLWPSRSHGGGDEPTEEVAPDDASAGDGAPPAAAGLSFFSLFLALPDGGCEEPEPRRPSSRRPTTGDGGTSRRRGGAHPPPSLFLYRARGGGWSELPAASGLCGACAGDAPR
jgi:hypothetical protein